MLLILKQFSFGRAPALEKVFLAFAAGVCSGMQKIFRCGYLLQGEGLRATTLGRPVTRLVAFTSLIMVVFCVGGRAAAGEVAIRRDEWGVPYIMADREEDAFFGLGYAQGEDRLLQILEAYVVAQGRGAEVFGVDALQDDLLYHQLRGPTDASAAFRKLSPQLRRNARAFAAGLNRYMEEHPEKVPDWAPAISPELSLLVERNRFPYFQDGYEDCARGGYDLEMYFESTRHLFEPARNLHDGSNGLALAPWRVEAGVSAHIADSHTSGLSGRYEFVLHGGSYSTAGYSSPGNWLPIVGNSAHVAWGETTGSADNSDCYVFDLNPQNSNQYKVDGEWRNITSRTVDLKIKDAPSRSVVFEHIMHNGFHAPVVARQDGKIFVVVSPYIGRVHQWHEHLYRASSAKNLKQFKAALALQGQMPVTITAADKDGIYAVRLGLVPNRPDGIDFTAPVSGADKATRWNGLHAFEDLVQVEDPVSGYIHTNNEEPSTWTPIDGPVPSDYPHYMMAIELGLEIEPFIGQNGRSLRGEELLGRLTNASVEDIIKVAHDSYLPTWGVWRDSLQAATVARAERVQAFSSRERSFLQELLNFDGIMDASSTDSIKALIWLESLSSVPGVSAPDFVRLMTKRYNGDHSSQADYDLLIDSVPHAVELLESYGRGDNPTMGDVVRIGRPQSDHYPTKVTGLKIGGHRDAPWTETGDIALHSWWASGADSEGRRWIEGGSTRMRVTVLTDPVEVYSVMPMGQSLDPNSPHYSDQGKLVAEDHLKPVWFHPSQIEQKTKISKVLRIP